MLEEMRYSICHGDTLLDGLHTPGQHQAFIISMCLVCHSWYRLGRTSSSGQSDHLLAWVIVQRAAGSFIKLCHQPVNHFLVRGSLQIVYSRRHLGHLGQIWLPVNIEPTDHQVVSKCSACRLCIPMELAHSWWGMHHVRSTRGPKTTPNDVFMKDARCLYLLGPRLGHQIWRWPPARGVAPGDPVVRQHTLC